MNTRVKPVMVTFDHNTYEFLSFPEKEIPKEHIDDREAYRRIRNDIESATLQPFISETILTIETINRNDRQSTLSRTDRIVSEMSSEESVGNRHSGKVTVMPNIEVYPKNKDHFPFYLPKAIALGFKILPSYRAGKIINPFVDSRWYYIPETKDIWEIPNKFSDAVQFIEDDGFGFAALKKLIHYTEGSGKPWIYFLRKYSGSPKKLQQMIAEWSDADSIGITIANGIKYFCTKDGSGKTDKSWSVLSSKMKSKLNRKYGVEFVTPIELAAILSNT